MLKIYKVFFLIGIALITKITVNAQITSDSIPITVTPDSIPVSVNVDLEQIFNAKTPKQYVISDIKVTGTQSFDPGLIISISGLAVGDKVMLPGADNFSKAINNLWKQNLISNVEIYFDRLVGNNLYIEISITERPRLTNFKYKGLKKSESDDLATKVGLSKGRVVTENMKGTAVENIRKFFVDKGYRNIDINVLEQKDPTVTNGVIMTFIVDKKGKVKINQVDFSDNNNVPDNRLKKLMKGTKEMSRLTLFPQDDINPYDHKNSKLSFRNYLQQNGYLSVSKTKELADPYFRFKLLSSSKFNDKKYQEDQSKVLDYYNSLGYRDAILVADTQYYNKKGNLNLAIKLNEGRKYYFGNITWRGNTKYSDSVLNVILGIKKGEIYNVGTLTKKLGSQPSQEGGDITSLYQDDGYLFFSIDPIETAVYNDTIDHEIRIVEGPQATIGKVTITGNDKTKEYVIRRELYTIPGEKFSREKIIRTQRELSQLGFFNPEKINPVPIPNRDNGTVDINWGLEEKSSDQLELSAGFGGGIGLTGTLGVTFNNFSINNIFKKTAWSPLPTGDGQKLSLRVQSNGKAYRSYNFSFTEPWFGGKKRNSFTVSYYNTKYSNAYDPSTGRYSSIFADSSFIKTTGFGISLGKQLKWPDDYFSLVYGLNLQQYQLKNYNIFPGLTNGNSTNVSVKITLARSSAGPNPIFPTNGSNFVLSGQFTPPYSLFRDPSFYKNAAEKYKFVEFHKERFNAEWYVPIGKASGADKNKQFILKAAAKYGFVGRYSTKTDISPFERFQLGDAGLSNNFALLGYDIIAHRGYPVYDNSDPKINPDQTTAHEFFTIFNKYTLELRYPFSTSASSTIYGLTFFEAANGWFKFNDYNPFKLRRSAGVGMRFFLPMFGLLGFDYGIGLDRIRPGEGIKSAGKFTFMLGQEPE
jgi:outer membrane protein insertion porin family